MKDAEILAPCGMDRTACSIYKAAHDIMEAERLAHERRSWQPRVGTGTPPGRSLAPGP